MNPETLVMIYQLRDKQGNPVRYSATVAKNGTTKTLGKADFTLTPGKQWRSDKTGHSYPVVWNLKIPSEQIDLNISSIINDSEVDARLTTYLTYWEGAVNIKGSHTGQGFMELQGYAANSKHR
jgi:predicted secreted hydrolase